ncbi:xylulokinase [Alicyclobacillus cellulosilyticus]|uniref:Xylulose kinase n=1 Tax=Alicyclobacillus cellulosilyticus TaxID=1003997 RepID=A0A917K761_9BACL|nr:xylulokinase [Alicyclobacillus cellulosilyticus]GGJ03500.1 xylulokinase [Alicyclobacillus cellulosilyticus]
MQALLGIDVGTSGVKVVLFDEAGQPLAGALRDYPLYQPAPGFTEQQPEEWWAATVAAIRHVMAASGVRPEDVAAVGFSGQMHGLVLLDGQGQVIRPAILWNDQRTKAQADWIAAHVGVERSIAWTANPPLPNFTATKLLWVREHEPDHYQRIAHVLLPKDYIRFRLTGELACDVSDASGTLFFDVAARRWSDEMLQALGVPAAWLPPVHESHEVVGRVSPEAAAATGLATSTLVVAGAGDQAAGAVGNGIVEPGAVSATIGTSGVVFAFTDTILKDPLGRLHTFCHAVPGAWHVMGVTQAAGGSMQWLRNQLGQLETAAAGLLGIDAYELLTQEAAQAPAGSEGLLFLPYLNGERTPHLNPAAKGVFFGLTSRHQRAHLIRSVMEGVAYSLQDCLALIEGLGIPVGEIRASGGGARSPLWRSILANVFGRAVTTIHANEGPAFGAALLAGVGAGIYPSVQEACRRFVRTVGAVEPDPQAVAVYAAYGEIYRSLYQALQGEFRKVDDLVRRFHG